MSALRFGTAPNPKDDVDPYDFGSIMHYDEFAFSRNNHPMIETLNGEAIGQRNGLSDGDVQAINFMCFPSRPLILPPGVYTIQQKEMADQLTLTA